MPFSFMYWGKKYDVILKFSILVILGDTEGHDRLCARYKSRGLGVACLCRHCDIPTSEIDNAFYDAEHHTVQQVQDLVAVGDDLGLQAISQHNVPNAFYHPSLGINDEPWGIHGITPGEPLHIINLGLFGYALMGFYVALGMNPKQKAANKTCFVQDAYRLSLIHI